MKTEQEIKEKLIAAITEIYNSKEMNCVVIYDEPAGLQYIIGEGTYPKEIQIEISRLKKQKHKINPNDYGKK